MVANGKILTNKPTRRLRGDRQPVHRLGSAAKQLDRRAPCRPCRASCRCPMRQRTLHHTAACLRPSTRRATGQVPQDRGPRSQAEGRSALRRSGHRHRRAEPQPILLRLVRSCAAGQGVGARAARRERARHEGRGMVEHASIAAGNRKRATLYEEAFRRTYNIGFNKRRVAESLKKLLAEKREDEQTRSNLGTLSTAITEKLKARASST